MYNLKLSIVSQCKPNAYIQVQKIITQLRTRYSKLNGYQYNIGLKESPFCACGQHESIQNYIEDCVRFEDIRESLRNRLFQSARISEFSTELFREVKVTDPY